MMSSAHLIHPFTRFPLLCRATLMKDQVTSPGGLVWASQQISKWCLDFILWTRLCGSFSYRGIKVVKKGKHRKTMPRIHRLLHGNEMDTDMMIFTWNLQSLFTGGAVQYIRRVLSQYKADITAL